jgi:xanthine dehydrogenase YagS FAD-binding subunit
MIDFEYVDATKLESLPGLLHTRWGKAEILAGGTDLLDRLKERIDRPERVVNIKNIKELHGIKSGRRGLEIGALTTIAELEHDERLQKDYAVLAEAAASIATPQLRQMGTLGGNLCQRPRCWYFRGGDYPCLKKGGFKCYAVEGMSKYNAILGGGPSFIVHPSDAAPALVALGASLEIYGPEGKREQKIERFFQLPYENLMRENNLAANEVITRIRVPKPAAGTRSTYVKFREKQSLDFALSSVAAVLQVDGDVVEAARLVLGGVAPIPWHVPEAEAELVGRRLTTATIDKAAAAAVADASALDHNGYKVKLSENLVRRALGALAA